MEILAVVAIILITVYVIVSVIKFDVPESISDTHYLWQDSANTVFGKHVFTFTMWAVSLLVLPYMIQASTSYTQWLAFLGCGALMFVGTACEFKESLTHAVHFGSAYTWAACTLIWVFLNVLPAPAIAGLAVAVLGLIVQSDTNRTFWMEIGCILALSYSVIYKIFC